MSLGKISLKCLTDTKYESRGRRMLSTFLEKQSDYNYFRIAAERSKIQH